MMTNLVISSAKKTQVVRVRGDRASYSPPFRKDWAVGDFKAAVPWSARDWNGSAWSCTLEYLDAMTTLAGEFGPVEVEQ